MVPGSFSPSLFSSRCRAHGKALQEERAEEPGSLGGCTDLTPRAVQGLLELASVPRTQRWAGDPTTGLGWMYLRRNSRAEAPPGTGTEEEVGLLPRLARRGLPAVGISLSSSWEPPSAKLRGGNACPGSRSPSLWDQKGSFAHDLVPEAQQLLRFSWKQEQQTARICCTHPFQPTGVYPREASGVISVAGVAVISLQQLIRAVPMLSSLQKEQLPILAHGSAQGLGMLPLPDPAIESPEQGKGLTHPPVGVSSCTASRGQWSVQPPPSGFSLSCT